MALKPTIYKVDLQLVDMNREVYISEKLTLAQHPSETLERMMVRLVVYGLNYHEQLQFCKGLSAADEADLWQIALNGQIEHWLEVGQATPERIRKGVSRAAKVSLYAYGREANIWWDKYAKAFAELPKVAVWQFNAEQAAQLDSLVDRTMSVTLTISENEIYLNQGDKQLTLGVTQLL